MTEVSEAVLTYDWNGSTHPMSDAHTPDIVVAMRVRMLMRDQLDHEAVCVMARDRIMALSKEVARLTAALAERPKATPADDALIAVVSATRAYLPPDGIDAQECLNQILAATDNVVIANYLSKLEADL